MKTTIVLSNLFSLISFTTAQSSFGGMSARSASPIHLQQISANGGTFWIGKNTSSYCPSGEVPKCPEGTSTVFVGGNDTLSLDVEVPGGQQVYVAPSGRLSFTQAHSASIPAGSIRTGFNNTQGPSFGVLSWEQGFVACPTDGTNGPWQVYGERKGAKLPANCLGFDFLTPNGTGPGAWEYN